MTTTQPDLLERPGAAADRAMPTATATVYEFYAEHKGAWITSRSVLTKADADRLNKIIGREFYRPATTLFTD